MCTSLLVTFNFLSLVFSFFFFFFNDTATTEIYTLSLHDALPISTSRRRSSRPRRRSACWPRRWRRPASRSEEHTSELQSRPHLVCRLLLEKKKKKKTKTKNQKKHTTHHKRKNIDETNSKSNKDHK